MSGSLPQQWLDRASEDLTVARLVFQEEHYSHTCFLAQQCIEKSLKGYLLAQTNTYPRIHSLTELLALCEVQESDFDQFYESCATVDQYYMPARYPDSPPGTAADGPASKEDAEKAIEIAEKVYQFVQIKLLPPEEDEQTQG